MSAPLNTDSLQAQGKGILARTAAEERSGGRHRREREDGNTRGKGKGSVAAVAELADLAGGRDRSKRKNTSAEQERYARGRQAMKTEKREEELAS